MNLYNTKVAHADIVEPAIGGNLNVLESALKYGYALSAHLTPMLSLFLLIIPGIVSSAS